MKKVYLIAVVFALIAAIATYMFATQLDKKTTLKDAETVPVVVALAEIPQNTIITEEMLADDAGNFTVKQIPKDYAPTDALGDPSELQDKVICIALQPNDQVSLRSFVGEDSDKVGLSFKLQDGHQAFSIRASDINGVDGYISTGDTVDIVTTETDKNGNVKAKVAYKNLKVLRVSNNADDTAASSSDSKITAYSTITVDVTPQQVLKLKEIVATTDYTLVLNSRKSDQAANTKTTQAANTTQAE